MSKAANELHKRCNMMPSATQTQEESADTSCVDEAFKNCCSFLPTAGTILPAARSVSSGTQRQ